MEETSQRYDIPIGLVAPPTIELGITPKIYPEVQGEAVLGATASLAIILGGLATGAVAGGAIGSAVPGVGTVIGVVVGSGVGLFSAAAAAEAYEDRNIPLAQRTPFTDDLLRKRMADARRRLVTRVESEISDFLVKDTPAAASNRRLFVGGMVSEIEHALKDASRRVEALIR